jgi:diguanylate cyclase (GGDEF)-like protein
MTPVYNPWLVALSIVVAVFVSYTALCLASRVATSERPQSQLWLGAGAIAMGAGIWSMHFIGMLAFSLPVPLTYSVPETLLSLAVAVLTSGFALAVNNAQRLTLTRLSGGALIMGTGISAMHYTGMAAIAIQPAIHYDRRLVGYSFGIAVAASFVALWLFFRLRHATSLRQTMMRVGAAAVMGCAISGMHYTAMAASRFSLGSICRGGVTVDNSSLATTIAGFVLGLLAVALVTTVYDSYLQSRIIDHANTLERANAELRHQSLHDALTGLPNRLLFVERLRHEITRASSEHRSFATLAVDLDRFKVINDTLGHAVGDALLVQVAARMVEALPATATVARMGGDEFLILLTDAGDRSVAAALAADIGKTVAEPFRIASRDVHTAVSVGISMFPDDGPCVDTLIARADEAMYLAKRGGRNTFRFFDPDHSLFPQYRLDLENELRRALPSGQFELHYQPKMDVATDRMNSVEALIRWRHPERGLVNPAEFLPLAAETGLMYLIDEWALREACRQAALWRNSGMPFLRIAVNVSPVHFRQETFLRVVQRALSDHGLESRYLEIELTETTVMDDAEGAVAILEELSRMGILVSIDDFGTGYSSMNYLRRLPIDKLKIDRSFVSDLTTSADARAIVSAVISLAHSLRLKVVAEGVETAAQLDQLRQLGCDQYQGFYRSPAVVPQRIEAMTRSSPERFSDNNPAAFLETHSKLAAFTRRRP